MSLVSCGGDDDDSGGGGISSGGGASISGIWYIDMSEIAKASDFTEIEKAIRNSEVLSSYTYGGEKHQYVASYNLFIMSSGMYNDSDAYFGRLRFSITPCVTAYRIVNSNTIMRYIGYLYVEQPNTSSLGTPIYKFYAGAVFGNMAYYDNSPTTYTYIKSNNKLILSNGTILTESGNNLLLDGSSQKFTRYTP